MKRTISEATLFTSKFVHRAYPHLSLFANNRMGTRYTYSVFPYD